MGRYPALLLLCVLAVFSLAFADQFGSQQVVLKPGGPNFVRNTLDDPQPDTIRYDNNVGSTLNTGHNFWVRVKFTCPNAFELRSIYFQTINGQGSTAPCSVFVYTAVGENLGTVLSMHVVDQLIPDFDWVDTNIPTPLQFNANDNFFVVIGPNPGGPQTEGWHVIFDNANTNARSKIASTRTGNYVTNGGDYLIRAGGQVSPFTDLRASECYYTNRLNASDFNLLPSDTLLFKSKIFNAGNTNVAGYTVAWTVHDPNGAVVFTDEVAVTTTINRGTSASVQSALRFAPATNGEYMGQCVVTATGDAVAENNTARIRFFVGGLHRWFRYDDNDLTSADDGYTGFSTGNGWGVAFKPVSAPCVIDTIRMDMGAAGTGDFRIYMNDPTTGNPTGNPVWSATPTVVAGWNKIAVNPPIQLFSIQKFTIAYLYSGVAFGKDGDGPNDAEIIDMGITAFQAASDGAQWSQDVSGNWNMQVYMDTTSALPPFPVIGTSTDTLRFGAIDTLGTTNQVLTFWIYNRGNNQALNVTGITFTPTSLSNVYTPSRTTLTVAAGDSQSVDVTFNPRLVIAYPGIMGIANNSNNLPVKNMVLRGNGAAHTSISPIEGSLPSQYRLSQNYPNPFNPSTDIEFALPMSSSVKLTVYNVLGQEVALLADGEYTAGVYRVTFDASHLTSGLYFYKLEAGSFTALNKMMLMK